MKNLVRLFGGVLVLALTFGACDGVTDPEGEGRVQILLTDAPADYIESAEVWISCAYLKGGGEEEEETEEGTGHGQGVDLFNDAANPFFVDLLTLRDGITIPVTEVESVEAGTYHQLRLVVSKAEVTLDGIVFKDGSTKTNLHVPSGMQSGIKVHLNAPIEVTDGSLTIVTVDFDVDENFKLQGNPETPAGIQGILFTPTLKEKGRSEG